MKTLSLLAALTVAISLLQAPVRADDPATGKLSQVRGLLDDLLKTRSSGSTGGTAPTAPATDPAAPAAPTADPKLSPELIAQARSLFDELRKLGNLDSDEGTAPTAPAAPTGSTAPTTPSGTAASHVAQKAPATAQRSQALQPSTGLTTNRLTTSHLAPSAGLGGKGLTGGTPQASDTDWRKLFPVQGSK